MSNIVSDYQDLLTSDESLHALDSAVRLAARIASGTDDGTNGHRWIKLLRERSPISPHMKGGRQDARRIKEVSWALLALPRTIERRFAEIPEDQYSILMDTLLLVFHQAYFSLLPTLSRGSEELLSVFREYSASLPPRDRFQVLGLADIHRGRFDAAADSFRTALAATHSDEHDFITRVQMLWTILMEHGLYSDAFDCLMDVYSRASRVDLSEVSALLRETFAESSRRHMRTSGNRIRKRA